MARTYSATSDQHRFPLITEMTTAFSIGAWVKRATDTTFDTIYSRMTSGSAPKMSIQIGENDKVALEIVGGTERESTATILSTDGWVFVAVDKATGAATPRVHIWKRASGWTHQNMGGTTASPTAAGAGATVRIGEWQGGTVDNFNGDIESVVEYNGVQLSDAQWESAAFSRQGMLSKRPTGLWELHQSAVTEKVPDITGSGMNESVRAGTTVATRSCPFYFKGGPPRYTRQGGEEGAPAELAFSSSPISFSGSAALTVQTSLSLAAGVVSTAGSMTVTAQTSLGLSSTAISTAGSMALTASPALALGSAPISTAGSMAVSTSTGIAFASSAISTAGSMAMTAPTSMPLSAGAITTSGSMTVTAQTKITLSSSVISTTGSMSLTAKNALSLSSASISTTGSMSVTATNKLSLGSSAITTSGSASVSVPLSMALNSSAITTGGSAAFGVLADIPMQSSDISFTGATLVPNFIVLLEMNELAITFTTSAQPAVPVAFVPAPVTLTFGAKAQVIKFIPDPVVFPPLGAICLSEGENGAIEFPSSHGAECLNEVPTGAVEINLRERGAIEI